MSVQRPPYTLRRRVRPLNVADEFGADPSGAADSSAAFQAAHDALGPAGGVLEVNPGRYKILTGITAYDKPSVRWVGLGGKHYQGTGTTATPTTDGGAVLEGWTPGMTLVTVDRPGGNTNATHQGPTFENIGFQDGRLAASRRTLSAVALVSGTTYRFTTTVAHTFTAVAGNNGVYINGVSNATDPYGTAFNGKFTVTNIFSATTFDVDVGSNPSTAGLVFTTSDVRYAPTMTLLDIEHETRARLRDCHFHGGLVGLNFQGVNDISWANLYGCGFNLNDKGIYFSGDQAQSIAINGGDYQVANGQIGIDYAGSRAMFKARDFKMDTIYNDGQGVIGIRLQQASNYMIDGSMELDGPNTGILIGTAGNSYGRISCSLQGNNGGSRGSRVGTGIKITGTSTGVTSTNADVADVSIVGTTFNGYGKCVDISNSRGVKVIGGSYAFCDTGVNIASTCQGTIVAFFSKRRAESGGNLIIDAGAGTRQIFCDDVNVVGGIVPAAGATSGTTGFLYIPAAAGPPSGAPPTFTGTVPLYYDTTNHKLYAYDSGWKTQSAVFA